MARSPVREAAPEFDRFGAAPHPRDAGALVGHARAEDALLDAYRSGRLAHSWIIGGSEGIGKATLAWRFARFLFVNPDPRSLAVLSAPNLATPRDHPSVRRLSAMSHGDAALLRRQWNEKSKRHFTEIRIDDVRDALDLFRHASGEGGWRICLVDCAEDLNRSSANALLKIVEEPPPRSLFLLIAHRPGQVLATLRSRSRILTLSPLTPDEVVLAIRALGPPWSEKPQQDIAAAAARSGGSVREALRLIDGGGLNLTNQVETMLAALPRLDWRAVHTVADAVSSRDAEDAFKSFVMTCYDWLGERGRADGPVASRAAFAEAWEKIAFAARETDALNLDRRPFVLGVFADLAEAAETAASRFG